jgi:hypothetical protein
MTVIQEFSKKLEVEASDHERSILLVDILNAKGFSKNEREIHIYDTHLRNEIMTNLRTTDTCALIFTGSTSEGMCGGMYNTKTNTIMICYTQLDISSNTSHVQTILTTLHCYCYMTMKIMMHLFLLKKMTTFQDMSNYRWRSEN